VIALRPVVNTFDRVWYGFAQVNEAMYDQFRQDVERPEEPRTVTTTSTAAAQPKQIFGCLLEWSFP